MRSERVVVLSDVHVPFENVKLWKGVLRFITDWKPDRLVVAGDFLDLFSLSKYAADSVYQLSGVTLSMEYASGNKRLDELDAALVSGTKKAFLWGNHEDRYWRELQKGDRGKYGDALVSPTTALRLRARGYTTIGEEWQQDVVKLGSHLDVTHGIWCPIHAAKKHLDEFQGSVMFGHTHRMQSYYSGRRAAFNIGGLFDIESRGFFYMPRAKRLQWTNGFGLVEIDAKGDFWATCVQAREGTFIAKGKRY